MLLAPVMGSGCRTEQPGIRDPRECAMLSTHRYPVAAPLAQSAERLHGKEKVYGSIP